jgi:pimeloyl-[acyl-carrier protein] methyl ester esterase
MSQIKTIILNGWAASPRAWDLCTFPRAALFSYLEQLDGLPERMLAVEESVVLVGWSMGGSSALRLALRFPEKIRGLVLIAATPRMMQDALWRGMSPRRFQALRKGALLLQGEPLFAPPPDRPNPYQADCEENLDRGLDYLLATDLRAELTQARPRLADRFPATIFQSARDGIVRAENASFLKEILPQADLEIIPGTEHALPVAIPRQIDDAVRRCLTLASVAV